MRTNSRNRRPRRLPPILHEADVARLKAHARTLPDRDRAIILTLMGAGLRVSEICDLTRGELDLARGVITVRQGKGGVDRVVPIANGTTDELRRWIDIAPPARLEDPVFPHARDKTRHICTRWVQYLVKETAAAAGIARRVTPHTLRHTYATELLRRGLTIRDVQSILGHASVITTQIYTHVDPEDLRRKIQAEPPAAPPPQQRPGAPAGAAAADDAAAAATPHEGLASELLGLLAGVDDAEAQVLLKLARALARKRP